MLVAAGMVTEAQVKEALARQKQTGRRLGETLVTLGYVSEAQMTQVLSNQLTIPWVNLYHVDFSRELLDLVPAELAEQYCLVPVYIRHVRRQGDTLYVAMDDPLNTDALQRVADHAGLPVKPMVASPTDIRNAIRVYYLGQPPLDEDFEEIEDSDLEIDEPEAKVHGRSDVAQTITPTPLPKEESRRESEKPAVVESGPIVTPSAPPQPRAGSNFLTLTLLDGTTVRLPSPGASGRSKGRDNAPERGMTTRDLIHALRARAAGKDVGDVLPDNAWESLFATLLSVLLRKGLVADWEFVDEWQKHAGERSRKEDG